MEDLYGTLLTVRVTFPDNHPEFLTVFEYSSHLQPVILGFPWLKQRNLLNWNAAEILSWVETWKKHGVAAKVDISSPIRMLADTETEIETLDPSTIPPCYHDLTEVLSKI